MLFDSLLSSLEESIENLKVQLLFESSDVRKFFSQLLFESSGALKPEALPFLISAADLMSRVVKTPGREVELLARDPRTSKPEVARIPGGVAPPSEGFKTAAEVLKGILEKAAQTGLAPWIPVLKKFFSLFKGDIALSFPQPIKVKGEEVSKLVLQSPASLSPDFVGSFLLYLLENPSFMSLMKREVSEAVFDSLKQIFEILVNRGSFRGVFVKPRPVKINVFTFTPSTLLSSQWKTKEEREEEQEKKAVTIRVTAAEKTMLDRALAQRPIAIFKIRDPEKSPSVEPVSLQHRESAIAEIERVVLSNPRFTSKFLLSGASSVERALRSLMIANILSSILPIEVEAPVEGS